MILRFILSILVFNVHLHAVETANLALTESNIILSAPKGWVVKKQNGEVSIFSSDQPAKGSPARIHIVRPRNDEKSLEQAIEAEISLITERSPGSGNSREHYKGIVPVNTVSGIKGLRADFYFEQTTNEITTKRYHIVKYYFLDETDRIFKVCAHIYGDEQKQKTFEALILNNLAPEANK